MLCYITGHVSFLFFFFFLVFSSHLLYSLGFPCGSAGKESACHVGDLGLIPGLGRSPGKGKGDPFQHSGQKNSMDCIICGVAKSWTWLSDFHFTSLLIVEGGTGLDDCFRILGFCVSLSPVLPGKSLRNDGSESCWKLVTKTTFVLYTPKYKLPRVWRQLLGYPSWQYWDLCLLQVSGPAPSFEPLSLKSWLCSSLPVFPVHPVISHW